MKNSIALLSIGLLATFQTSALISRSAAVLAAPKSSAQPTQPAQTMQTASTVEVIYDEWSDSNRNRSLPVKIYLPKQIAHAAPVVIFSHGLGGSREAAAYLGNAWAEHGYIGIFIQHPGSDESFWKPSLASGGPIDRTSLLAKFGQQLKDPIHAVNRAQDVHFIIDKLTQLDKSPGPLAGKMDLNEIAIAGHSFGSWTALAASGQAFVSASGKKIESGDPRIKAAIYLSPTVAKKGADLDLTYGGIKIPGLHLTGTDDDSPVNSTKAEERRIPYDHIKKSDQYLVVLNNADHMVFGAGRRRLRPGHDDVKQQEIVADVSTKFLDAYLRHDTTSLSWLRGAGAKTELSGKGSYEYKIASASK